jgi:tRNA-dihydrouridine synthase
VFQVRQAFPTLPIIGAGGVRTGNDALEFLLAGASAVSVGTSIFNDPSAPMRVHEELARLVAERGFARVSDVIGHAHRERDAVVTEAQADADESPVPDPGPEPGAEPDDDLAAWDFIRE